MVIMMNFVFSGGSRYIKHDVQISRKYPHTHLHVPTYITRNRDEKVRSIVRFPEF